MGCGATKKLGRRGRPCAPVCRVPSVGDSLWCVSVEERECGARLAVACGERSYQLRRERSLASRPVAPAVGGAAVGDEPCQVRVCRHRVYVVDLVGEGVVAVHGRYRLGAEVAYPGVGLLALVDEVYPGLARPWVSHGSAHQGEACVETLVYPCPALCHQLSVGLGVQVPRCHRQGVVYGWDGEVYRCATDLARHGHLRTWRSPQPSGEWEGASTGRASLIVLMMHYVNDSAQATRSVAVTWLSSHRPCLAGVAGVGRSGLPPRLKGSRPRHRARAPAWPSQPGIHGAADLA